MFALGALSVASVSIIAILFLVRYYELRLEHLQNENEELEAQYSGLMLSLAEEKEDVEYDE